MNKEEHQEYLKKISIPLVNKDVVDLHNHTTISDGTLAPQELIDLAAARGVKIMAVTDHDSVGGFPFLAEYGKKKGITVIPGIEFSCDESSRGFDEVHILGLLINPYSKELIARTKELQEKRSERSRLVINKIRELGYDITYEEVEKKVGDSFGRPHIAQILMEKYPQKFTKVQDVFDALVGTNKPAYIPRLDKISVKEAIEVVKAAGGFASLAHPCLYKDEDVKELVKYFAESGGEAIEAEYPYHTNTKGVTKEVSEHKRELARKLAKQYKLFITGGSDFHGSIRPVTTGDCGITTEKFEEMRRIVSAKKIQ
ncbi:MAG TPA: PHP domain-containing protein [Candidatus Nanoarchaeia archaeon]|nr:PHP domain-containing protein [Candidatus Nanoarchaeia archaeon]